MGQRAVNGSFHILVPPPAIFLRNLSHSQEMKRQESKGKIMQMPVGFLGEEKKDRNPTILALANGQSILLTKERKEKALKR